MTVQCLQTRANAGMKPTSALDGSLAHHRADLFQMGQYGSPQLAVVLCHDIAKPCQKLASDVKRITQHIQVPLKQ